MDFLFHRDELLLANRGVEGLLHFLLDGDLALPEENLALSLNDLAEDVSLLLLKLSDLVLKLDGLVFKLLKFLFKLDLDVEVCILEGDGGGVVAVFEIVELVHFEGQVLVRYLQLPNALVVGVYLLVQPQLLLLQNHLLSLKLVDFVADFSELGLVVDEVALVGDPIPLGFDVLNLDLFNFAFDTVSL